MTKFVRLGCVLLAGLIGSAGVRAANLTPVDAGGGALSPPVAQNGYLYVGTGATLSVWNWPIPPIRSTKAAAPMRRRRVRSVR